jgi:hypothetical protein
MLFGMNGNKSKSPEEMALSPSGGNNITKSGLPDG